MPNHKVGVSYSFSDLAKAYAADPQTDDDAHFLLSRGDEILALCLRYKYNHDPSEVCVGDAKAVAKWGDKLAELKGKKTLPLYYSPRNRTLYEYKGQYLIAGDTADPAELESKKGPGPLSRVVFLHRVEDKATTLPVR
jgi:hypothetical protein